MAISGGYGLQIKIQVAGVPTVVAHMLEMDYPRFEKVLAESTAHDSPGGWAQYTATGKRRMGDFTTRLGWDKSQATHAAIQAAFDSLNPVSIIIVSPGTAGTITMDAHIQALEQAAEQEELYTCEVTIQPTGQPTIT